MAITAAMTLSSATSKSEQQVAATCTITNSGSVSVNLISIQPLITQHSATNQSVAAVAGTPPIGGAFPVAIAGSSGTLAVTWPVLAHAPVTSYNQGAELDSLVYDIGAIVITSDGAITSATTTTLTVSHPSN